MIVTSVKPQPSFLEATKEGFRRLFDFKGRTRRSAYWWFVLVFVIIYVIMDKLLNAFFPPLVAGILSLFVIYCMVAINVRRLQDRGVSKWWAYLNYLLTVVFTLYSNISLYGDDLQGSGVSPRMIMDMVQDPIVITLTIISTIISLVIFINAILDGKKEPNAYGPSPKYIVQED